MAETIGQKIVREYFEDFPWLTSKTKFKKLSILIDEEIEKMKKESYDKGYNKRSQETFREHFCSEID